MSNDLSHDQAASETKLVRSIVAWLIRLTPSNKYDIKTDFAIEHVHGGGLRVDILIFDRYAHPSADRRLGIEVKIVQGLHDLATGIGQVMLYRQFLPDVWLALQGSVVAMYYAHYLAKLPIKILDVTHHVLYVKGRRYDPLRYMRKVRYELG